VYLQLSMGCALRTCRDAGNVADSRLESGRCSVGDRAFAPHRPRSGPLSARPRARCPAKQEKHRFLGTCVRDFEFFSPPSEEIHLAGKGMGIRATLEGQN